MATKNPNTMTTAELLAHIEQLQGIQKTHHPRTAAWQTASELLAPCFAEMAKRDADDELCPFCGTVVGQPLPEGGECLVWHPVAA